MEPNLQHDERWRRLHDHSWTCAGCGEVHAGLFDLGMYKPDYWTGDDPPADNLAIEIGGSVLTEDFCVIDGEDFFIRCVLELPILGAPGEHFAYGVWSSLSQPNFERYVETFDDGEQSGLGPWFGWFSNRLHGYPNTIALKCDVHPRDDRLRPTIELEPTDHPLAVEQREGIGLDRLIEIYALHGHDLKDALSS